MPELDSLDEYCTLSDLDQGFFDLFDCHFVGNDVRSQLFTISGAEVDVFIRCWPYGAAEEDRVFPAIAVELFKFPTPARDRNSSTEGGIPVSSDLEAENPTITYSEELQPFNLEYIIHLYARNLSDYDTLASSFFATFISNDIINANGTDWHIFFEAPAKLDEVINDQITYHLAIPVRVQVNMPLSGARNTTTESAVTDITAVTIEEN